MEGAPAARDFESVYRSEAAPVWSYLRRLGIPGRNLEDLVHDVFVVAYRQLPQFDTSRPLRPWLFGIAFRVASDHRRRAQNQREVLKDEIHVAADGPGGEAALMRRQRQHLVLTALDSLTLTHRAVFVLHEIEGYSIPEIARMLDLPPNTLYSRLRRAREQFVGAVRRLAGPKNGGEE